MTKHILGETEPSRVFYWFEELSAIPRGSGKTRAATRFCEEFAEKNGLPCLTDEAGNVIIKKSGSPGREQEPAVILQGHLDMVWEKAEGSDFDFEHSGLQLQADEKYVFARGTTLGGDDGIAVAMALALLEDDTLSHPPLEVLFTVDEEVGMKGATALDTSPLQGKRMLNLDSEEEGTLWVSCAGGVRTETDLPLQRAEAAGTVCTLTVSGLHGGHSGAEIHKGYANAVKETGKLLSRLFEHHDFGIVALAGGTMDNAITRVCECTLCLYSDWADFAEAVREQGAILKKECPADPDLQAALAPGSTDEQPLTRESTKKVIGFICDMPFGVQAMSSRIEGLVETSLNPGITAIRGNTLHMSASVRSGVDKERERLTARLADLAKAYGADFDTHGAYPAWEFRKDSPLQKTMGDVFERMFGQKPVIKAIHAGLECGIFCGKIPGLDCVSFGPAILDIHTPQERLELGSVKRTWDYLIGVLKAM